MFNSTEIDWKESIEIEEDRNVKTILGILVDTHICKDKSEAKRLIIMELVYYNEELKNKGMFDPITIKDGDTLRIKNREYKFTLI